MALDLRIVIGRLLLAIGLQLFVFGLLSDGRVATMNIAWGGVITIAGGVFYLIRRLGKTA